MKLIDISIIIIIATTSCKSKNLKAAEEIASKTPNPTYMNVGKEKYSTYIPDGWTALHRKNYGIDCDYLIAPITNEDINTSVNIANEFMQYLSLDEYLKGTINSVKKAIPSAVILDQGKIVANDINGVWYSYTMEPQGIKATLVSYIFPKDGVAYILTAGTEITNATKHRSTFDSIAKSFRFIKE